MALIACALFASGKSAAWFLAPRFACTLLPLADARPWMYSPALFDPTKEMALMEGSSMRKLTVSCAPWITLTTPSGTPAIWHSSAMSMEAPGVLSEGFKMMTLPVAMAIGRLQRGIMAGKLKGQMAATTPRGSRYDLVSMSLATSSTSPCSWVVMPQAVSQT